MDAAAAEGALLEWTVGSNALALVMAAQQRGVLDALRVGATPDSVAASTGIEAVQALRVCMALEALQVVERDGSLYRLTEGWATVAGANRPVALRDRFGLLEPLRRGLLGAFDPPLDFGAVDPAEAVALARSVWGVANSPMALESWATLDAAMPEVRAVWEAGCRHAEFGCGAGRDLLRVVAMYPKVTAVGYDILPHVLDHARALARELDINDRVELRCQDVLTAQEEAAFDTIVWSQMFFEPAIRPLAFRSIRRALKRGGFLVMSMMAELPDPEKVAQTNPQRMQLTAAVAYRRWSIHWPQTKQLVAETEAAGFAHLHTIPHPRTPFLAFRMES